MPDGNSQDNFSDFELVQSMKIVGEMSPWAHRKAMFQISNLFEV